MSCVMHSYETGRLFTRGDVISCLSCIGTTLDMLLTRGDVAPSDGRCEATHTNDPGVEIAVDGRVAESIDAYIHVGGEQASVQVCGCVLLTRVRMCERVRVCICVCVCACTFLHACVRACVSVCVYACTWRSRWRKRLGGIRR